MGTAGCCGTDEVPHAAGGQSWGTSPAPTMHVQDPLQNRNTGVQEIGGGTLNPTQAWLMLQGTRKEFLGEPSPALVSGRPPPEPLMGRARREQGDSPFLKVYIPRMGLLQM